jgi:hypothetical protein
VALKTAIAALFSTANKKKCIQQQKDLFIHGQLGYISQWIRATGAVQWQWGVKWGLVSRRYFVQHSSAS